MPGELPVLKRFCLCLPLRFGLLTWGYFKLITDLLLIFLIYDDVWSRSPTKSGDGTEAGAARKTNIFQELILPLIVLFILVTDFILSAVLIIGGHMKKLKLLRVFYYYGIGFWVFTLLLSIVRAGFIINSMSYRDPSSPYWIKNLMELPLECCVGIVTQTYFLILLKSEIIKLSNNCRFRFVNNAAESESKMNYGVEPESGGKILEESVDKKTSSDKCELRGPINV